MLTSIIALVALAQSPVYPSPQSPPVAMPAPPVAYGDPYGFGGFLNAVRARSGLPPLAYDHRLSGLAAMNNSHQNATGRVGHFSRGDRAGQISGMGAFGTVCSMWRASPGHVAIMLSPYARTYGIAGNGWWWTASFD